MNVLTAIKGIFSAPKAVETGLRVAEKASDGVIRGLDAIWHTDEEKAADRQKAQETVLKFWEQFAKENSEQSKARRDIAYLLIKAYIGVLFIGIFEITLNISGPERIDAYIGWLNALHFGTAFLGIIGTYFVFHQWSKITKER